MAGFFMAGFLLYNRAKKAQNDGGIGVSKATVAQIEPRLRTADKLAAGWRIHGFNGKDGFIPNRAMQLTRFCTCIDMGGERNRYSRYNRKRGMAIETNPSN
jgi:hypothetical protein